ncbi:sensor histidine kinase [Cellulomonas sp. KRMCY2]|uniref:sensor histidine kinase n=1 Tax=Cellulomonas sp. KRMCY2 TaxID=1304865 RepID=UPI00045EBCED|nr:sensor histidine kinase [Cellulomonas sp. KRMCY2]
MTTKSTRSAAGPPAADRHRSARTVLSERADFWARSLRGWDLAFYLGCAIAACAMLVTGGLVAAVALSIGILVLLVVTYLTIGRRAAVSGSEPLALAYLAVLVVATVALVWIDPVSTIILFIAYSQIWFFSPSRRIGVAICTVLTIGVFGALVVTSPEEGVANIVAQGALALAFAVLLGLWVTQVAEQSEDRADLIARLEAAQEELGLSHHAAGVAAERERMAQEIHDTLAQGFTSIVMLAQTASADLHRGEAERAAERMALVEQTARDNLAEARALVAAFVPAGLQGSTLGEALERLAGRFEQETGVRVELIVPTTGPGVPVLTRDTEVVLLRAAQEALSNVRRHAAAQHVRLMLSAGGDPADGTAGVRLEVVDDGSGIAPSAQEGIGLRGMRARVRSGGGEVAVGGVAEGGTRVVVTLPMPDGDTTDSATTDSDPPDDGTTDQETAP